MTTLSTDSALAILASHGADPARWPQDVRAALLALAARDPVVAAALAEARALDAALDGWATAPAPLLAVDVAAITSLPQARPRLRPAASGWRPALMAAGLALMLVVGGWLGAGARFGSDAAVSVAAAPPPSAGAEPAEADAAFAYVFTPTAAEEELI